MFDYTSHFTFTCHFFHKILVLLLFYAVSIHFRLSTYLPFLMLFTASCYSASIRCVSRIWVHWEPQHTLETLHLLFLLLWCSLPVHFRSTAHCSLALPFHARPFATTPTPHKSKNLTYTTCCYILRAMLPNTWNNWECLCPKWLEIWLCC